MHDRRSCAGERVSCSASMGASPSRAACANSSAHGSNVCSTSFNPPDFLDDCPAHGSCHRALFACNGETSMQSCRPADFLAVEPSPNTVSSELAKNPIKGRRADHKFRMQDPAPPRKELQATPHDGLWLVWSSVALVLGNHQPYRSLREPYVGSVPNIL